jgi:hypothetical protein
VIVRATLPFRAAVPLASLRAVLFQIIFVPFRTLFLRGCWSSS